MITNQQNRKKSTTQVSIAVLASFLSQLAFHSVALADIIPDNTLGAEGSQFNANQIEGGATRGPNLFHSFEEFSIDENQQVEFSPDNTIETIFTRVTGSSISDLLGKLSISEDADFFLINPNGIFIGPDAELDMEGSFLASTADGIEFGDSFIFGTQNPTPPPDSLLVVQPSALIFNQLTPNAIRSQGRLEMELGEAFQLIGGDVILENDNTRVRAREGLIELGGLAEPGRVEFSTEGMAQFDENTARANVEILNDVDIEVDGTDGGSIHIYAHDLTLIDSEIQAGLRDEGDTPNSQAGDIVIDLTGNLEAVDSEIENKFDNDAQGSIGNIVLTVVGDILLENTEINSQINGIGESGNIQIQAQNLTVTDDSKIQGGFGDEAGTPESRSGDIIIDLSSNLEMTDSEIVNNLPEDTQGTIGSIILTVAGDINLESTEIKSEIEGIGNGGDIQIYAQNLNLNDSDIEAENDSEIDEDFENNNSLPDIQSGHIIIELTGNLQAFDSNISSELSRGATGDSGDITVTVTGDIYLESSDIESQLKGDTGVNGDILIYAQNLTLVDKAKIGGGFENSGGTPGRQSGDVIIVLTGDLEAFNKSTIINTVARNAEGNSGNIDVTVDGDIYLENSQIENEMNGIGESGDTFITVGGELFLNGGQIRNRVGDDAEDRIVQGNSGDIQIVADVLRMETPTDDGNGDQALISTTTEAIGNAGDIYISVNELIMIGPGESGSSGITSSASDEALGDAGSVFIDVNGDMLMTNRGKIESVVQGSSTGTGGDVIINAHSLTLTDDSAIKVLNKATGEPGNIEINLIGDLIISDNSDINASVEGENAGSLTINDDTGNVVINAHAVMLSDDGQIKVFATNGAGNAGQIEVTADHIEIGELDPMANPDELRSSASGFFSNSQASDDGMSSGTGGDIVLNVHSLRIGTNGVIDSSTDGEFGGGNIEITAEEIEILEGGQLIASTSAAGQAGNITITASDEVFISGIDPRLTEDTPTQSGIFSVTTGSGNAGQIKIQDNGDGSLSILIQDEGTVNAQALAQDGTAAEEVPGSGGDIILQAHLVQLDSSAVIDSSTARNAPGGNIDIDADRVELLNGGQLRASTSAEGQAGSINVIAADEILISGTAPETDSIIAADEIIVSEIVSEETAPIPTSSGIFTVTTGSGSAGQINIQDSGDSLNLVIQDRGTISAQALSQGNAGSIIIDIGELLTVTDGDIRTDASQSAGGEIIISADGIVLSGDGDILTNVASGANNGGDIVINGGYLVALDDSDILAFAQDGAGGNITLPIFFGQNFVPSPPGTDPNSLDLNGQVDINASGQLSSGTITFPDVSFIENNLTELSDTLVNADALVASSCIAQVAQGSGQFVLTGRDGLPQQPGTANLSILPTGTVRNLTNEPTTTEDNIHSAITEPQAVYQLPDGRLVMSRDCS